MPFSLSKANLPFASVGHVCNQDPKILKAATQKMEKAQLESNCEKIILGNLPVIT